MAKYTVTHSCGHEITHALFGKHSGFGGRDSKLEWLAQQPCMECKRAADQALRDAQNREAAEKNAADGCVQLEGSEKQVAWAESIRRIVITTFKDGLANLRTGNAPAAKIEAIEIVLAWLRTQNHSKWWIETIGTLKSTEGMAPLVAMIDGKSVPPSKREILRAVLLEAPTVNEETATLFGFADDFRARLTARAAAAAKSERRAELEASKPIAPAFWKEIAEKTKAAGREWHCNRKIYSGRRVYVSGSEYKLTPEQEAALVAFWAARDEWSKQLELTK